MLRGEGNARERWKTTIGLISKETTLHVQHTFLYISLPLFCTTTKQNLFFYGGNVVRILVHFSLFTAAHFLLALVAASISQFVTAATKFSCCSSNKKYLLCFLSLALDLCRPFSLPPTLSFSLSFSSPIFQINFVDTTIYLSLIL